MSLNLLSNVRTTITGSFVAEEVIASGVCPSDRCLVIAGSIGNADYIGPQPGEGGEVSYYKQIRVVTPHYTAIMGIDGPPGGSPIFYTEGCAIVGPGESYQVKMYVYNLRVYTVNLSVQEIAAVSY